MTSTAVPFRSTEEVARTIRDNINRILTERGRNLEWLAAEIGIDTHSILKAFANEVPLWLTLDASFYLEVAPDRLTEVPA